MWKLVFTNLAVGILLMIISIPMIYHKIRPNHFYGFRVNKTLENPQIWYDVNEYSGKRLFVAGAVISLAAMGVSLLPNLDPGLYSLITGAVNVVLMVVVLVQSIIYLNTL